MSAMQDPTLAAVWSAAVVHARASLVAVDAGELRASARQVEIWRATIAKAVAWGLACGPGCVTCGGLGQVDDGDRLCPERRGGAA
ncbi:hypothetical protein FHU33_3908 [Blastococcus colisei]|uniref:Uncharacterized protein n=1 Tax=Blastococcus colisei TaxID=1564162 RepID=A0A543PK01_9ACTN|nr:hypothetical protein [Blastococcus colisei]TQN44406.1 hypothetical protein FHU33_3908 [Blastococcus colisei]